jgi:hypothetical protein
MYGARHLGHARALFLFRSELDYHHHDVPRQKELLRGAFDGMHPDVDRWLDELDRTPAFYCDSITQIRMDTWSRGRVTLVGDAGYCPGPTSAAAPAWQSSARTYSPGSWDGRAVTTSAPSPPTSAQWRNTCAAAARLLQRGEDLDPHLTPRRAGTGPGRPPDLRPARRARRALLRLTTKSARLYNSMTVDAYPPSPTASRGRDSLAGDMGGGLGVE